MSGVAVATAAVAAAGAGASIYSAERQASAQKKAAKQQEEASNKQLGQQKAAYNKANQNTVDTEGLLESNAASQIGSTMLTGGQGINPSANQLGKGFNLLGG